MKDDKLLELGRDHGLALLEDLNNNNASGGEMVAAAAYLVTGVFRYVDIAAQDLKEVRDAFDKCLDIFLDEKSVKGNNKEELHEN